MSEFIIYVIFYHLQQHVPIYAAYLYDAVMVYVQAIQEVLALNESISNGTAVVAKIRDRTYTSRILSKYSNSVSHVWKTLTLTHHFSNSDRGGLSS